MTTVETSRLVLRRWREEDVRPFAAVNADPGVMRWIGDGSVHDEEYTRTMVGHMERHWEEEGFGLFAVEVRETGTLAGFTGLAVPRFMPEVLPAVEIGWRLGPAFWGRGLATEAARAVLGYGFREHGLDRVISLVQTGNSASARVTAKLGMRLDRELVASRSGRPTQVFALTRTEYAARERPPAESFPRG
jgi:RimJ/RimL family protein N-acetyltransferase